MVQLMPLPPHHLLLHWFNLSGAGLPRTILEKGRFTGVLSVCLPHRRHTWTAQSCSPGGGNVHHYLTHTSVDQPESTSQTHVDRFSRFYRAMHYNA